MQASHELWVDMMKCVFREPLLSVEGAQGEPWNNHDVDIECVYRYATLAFICGRPLRDELKSVDGKLHYDDGAKRAQTQDSCPFLVPGSARKAFHAYERQKRKVIFQFLRRVKKTMRSLGFVGLLFSYHKTLDDVKLAMVQYARNYETLLDNFRHRRNFARPTHQL